MTGGGGHLGLDLIRRGKISKLDGELAQIMRQHCDTSMDRILLSEGLATGRDVLAAHARYFKSRLLTNTDLRTLTPLSSEVDPAVLLKHAILPVKDRDGRAALIAGDPSEISAARAILPHSLRQARVLPAARHTVQGIIADHHRDYLKHMAQSRVIEIESCRNWGNRYALRVGIFASALLMLAFLVFYFPTAVFTGLAAWAGFTLLVSAGLKVAAFAARFSTGLTPEKTVTSGDKEPFSKISILVPLFREVEVVHALIARLTQLTYPKCLLDVILVLEEEDETTCKTLAGIALPPWIRVVVVPDGKPRTKPRAMNYALDFCEGDIIGVYDAEDAPEPDQLTKIAQAFQNAPEDVACLQGILDYYNPRQNWLSRCFTIEYATWFRTMMPGMSRLGFVIPLGGTTLFFRRDVLEKLGGWDAHNVTEDADLGFRLARHGYRTEMVETVTQEEANCRPWAWIKQRSRWLKGYMITYLVHMRQPVVLYRQLGAWKFWGFQAHFVTALSQFMLAPVLWSFWLVLLGLPHPLDTVLPRSYMVFVGSMFLLVEVLNIVMHAASVSGPKHKHLIGWAPTMHFYTPLGAIAAYKALYELVLRPFFWDKTQHGLSQYTVSEQRSDNTVHLAGVEFEPGDKSL